MMPPGIWTRREDSQTGKLLNALQRTNARFAEHLENWNKQVLPGDADEMLQEWESFLRLPDACTPIGATTQERQTNAQARFVAELDQSQPSYKALAALVGYTVELNSYRMFRADISLCGDHVYEESQKFVKRISYETGASDDVLECVLRAHAHIYGVPDFAMWDPAIVSALTDLRHHYVTGEYVESGGEITEWTNRVSPANSWDISGGALPIPRATDGWSCVSLWDPDVPANKAIQGLNHSAAGSVDADTLLKEKNFSLFLVFWPEDITGPADMLSDGADFTMGVDVDGAGGYEANFTYGTTTVTAPVYMNRFNYLFIAADATTQLIANANGDGGSVAHSGVAVVGDQGIALGGGFHGTVAEMISGDYDLAAAASVKAYLTSKYNIL